MSTVSDASGRTPANGGDCSKRVTIARSAGSHASPTLTYTGCTASAPRAAASSASSTALSSPPERSTAVPPIAGFYATIADMYSVTKRIDFCYGHRLLDYDGICKHPHGHNATAEIEVRTGTLDNRNMVCDFSDIKRIVKGWVDRELDHKMLLRHDDPLVAPLKQLGEPMFLLDSNPTVERIARLIFDYAREQGLPVVRVKVWETPTSYAEFGE